MWLGIGFQKTGNYAQVREMHEQDKAICEELGDRAGVAAAWSNLGNCYIRTGDHAQAREMHEHHKAICEELGDRAGVSTAWCNLGNCYCSMGRAGVQDV